MFDLSWLAQSVLDFQFAVHNVAAPLKSGESQQSLSGSQVALRENTRSLKTP